jgi:hypothetical protein
LTYPQVPCSPHRVGWSKDGRESCLFFVLLFAWPFLALGGVIVASYTPFPAIWGAIAVTAGLYFVGWRAAQRWDERQR